MIAASVDDLPEPVGPVTRTIPLRRPTILPSSKGRFSDSKSGTLPGITRITTAQVPRCMKMFTRKRLEPGRLKDTSHDPSFPKFSAASWLSPMRSEAMRRVSSQVSARAAPAGTSFPFTSTSGGFPGEKNRSLIFGEVLSIAASKAGVDMGAAAGAAAAAVRGAEEAVFATGFAGEDIFKEMELWPWCARFRPSQALLEST